MNIYLKTKEQLDTTKPRVLLSCHIRASKGVWGSAAPLVINQITNEILSIFSNPGTLRKEVQLN